MPHETITIFTLRDGRELHLDMPDWYFAYSGNVSIRTPHSTHVIYNKEEYSNRPFTEDFLQRWYLSKTPSDSAETPLNELSVKPFGDEETTFEILVTEKAVTEYCTSYPPLTMVEEK